MTKICFTYIALILISTLYDSLIFDVFFFILRDIKKD